MQPCTEACGRPSRRSRRIGSPASSPPPTARSGAWEWRRRRSPSAASTRTRAKAACFGREDIEIIKPAIEAAAARGLAVTGPFGGDTLFHRRGFDAFIVMLHDQGHIAAKLLARNAVAALTIGSPILFSSVAHGSAHDIAGKGIADPQGDDRGGGAAFEGQS